MDCGGSASGMRRRPVKITCLANYARQVGGTLEWDPAAERFTTSEEANGYLDREGRKGYELPEG